MSRLASLCNGENLSLCRLVRLGILAVAAWLASSGPAARELPAAQPTAEPSSPVSVAPRGVVSHVKVLSNHCEDVSSLEDWKRTYIREGMSDEEKALAIWRTVVRYRHQTNPPDEYLCPDKNVHDPLKTIHVYGYGMCCCATSNVCGLARYLGMKARGRSINVHTISEVYYDGAWHMVDGSLMNYFRKPDGSLASADEVRDAVVDWHRRNPGYRGDNAKLLEFARDGRWKQSGPPLLATCTVFATDGRNPAGVHGWHSTMQEYDYETAPEYETHPSLGYRLNVQLREGERLTRRWSHEGKVIGWTHADILSNDLGILRLQRELGDKAPGRVGNGTLEYDVPLERFGLGALEAVNLETRGGAEAGPVLRAADSSRPGVYVVRMPSSYVYLGGMAALKAQVAPGGAIAVSLSDNHGLDWTELVRLTRSGETTIDLSPHIVRRYDYRLKFELTGDGTGLDALRIANDIQHSQAPLPTLLPGRNTITFSAGPDEGTLTVEPNMEPGATGGRQLEIQQFHPVVDNARTKWARPLGRGSMTLALPAAPGPIARVRMNLGYRLRDARDRYDVAVSFDGGATWRAVASLEGPTVGATQYLVVSDVPANARQATVRFEGKEVNTTCLFALRIDVDYREPRGGFRPVKITYVWDENGQAKTHVHVARQPSETYTIDCGPSARVKSFSVELAE